MSAESAANIGGSAAHDFRNIHARRKAPDMSCIRLSGTFISRISPLRTEMPDQQEKGRPFRLGFGSAPVIAICAGTRNSAQKSAPGDLDAGCGIAISCQNIGDSKGLKVHGAGYRHAAVLIAEPS